MRSKGPAVAVLCSALLAAACQAPAPHLSQGAKVQLKLQTLHPQHEAKIPMYPGMALLFRDTADANLYLSYLKVGDRSSAGTLVRINALRPVETPLSGTIVEYKPDPGPSLIKLDLDRLPQGWDRSTWEAWESCYVFNMQLARAETKQNP